MSAITDEFHALISELENEGHALADRFRAAWDALKSAEPKLLDEAEQDAADVVHTAETQGVSAAITEAERAVKHLAGDAVSDVKAAVEGSAKDQPSA